MPLDDDFDGIADKWEREMYERRLVQYQEILNFNLNLLSPLDDNEQLDPDGVSGPLVDQAETGDAHTVKEEYRGYVLDGGVHGWPLDSTLRPSSCFKTSGTFTFRNRAITNCARL